MRISTSRELIFGRSGRPLGPNSGLDLGRGEAGKGNGEEGQGGGGERQSVSVLSIGRRGDRGEEEINALEERH